MTVEQGFHSHPSLNPWVAAFDGWVDLKNVLWFLEKGEISLPGPAAKKLRPALERGAIRNRVIVRTGRWDALPREIKSAGVDGGTYTIMEEVFIIDPSGVHTTSSVEDQGGWPFVDWPQYKIRGHVIQVEWRGVLRVVTGARLPFKGEPAAPSSPPPADTSPAPSPPPLGRPMTPFWLAYRKEMMTRMYEGKATTRKAMRQQMQTWAQEASGPYNVEVPSDDIQRQVIRELLPDTFPPG